ncbi:MAG TPA: helix-turn-helix transcriptional regulator [Bryobacteraceae bacterium]|nr:helix-turn-helix transcriptional regulator [Bryobacteraceae bacterium]
MAESLFKEVRQRLKMTQEEMAERLRIKRNTISQYETGRAAPSLEVLIRLGDLAMAPSVTDLRIAIHEQVRSRISALTETERDDVLPVIINEPGPFSELLQRVIAELRNVPVAPGLIKILQLCRKTNNDVDLWPAFTKAADYIEVELERRSRLGEEADARPLPGRQNATR